MNVNTKYDINIPPKVDIPKAVEAIRQRVTAVENADSDAEEHQLIVSDFVKLFTAGYLDEAPGVDPWDPHALEKWAMNKADKEDEVCVRFIINIWNPSRGARWKIGRFDVMDMKHLSELSIEIIAEWFKAPFWFNEYVCIDGGDAE